MESGTTALAVCDARRRIPAEGSAELCLASTAAAVRKVPAGAEGGTASGASAFPLKTSPGMALGGTESEGLAVCVVSLFAVATSESSSPDDVRAVATMRAEGRGTSRAFTPEPEEPRKPRSSMVGA